MGGANGKDVTERFSVEAQQVISLAQEEAQALQHAQLRTEHLLLGLARTETSIAARVFQDLDLSVERIRGQMVATVDSQTITTGPAQFTPQVEVILDRTLRVALGFGRNVVDSEHILIALLRHDERGAVGLLGELQVDPRDIDDRVRDLMVAPDAPTTSTTRKYRGLPTLFEEAPPSLIYRLTREIETELDRPAETADLLVALACIPDGLISRVLAELELATDTFVGAIERARHTELRPSLSSPKESTAEPEEVHFETAEASESQTEGTSVDEQRESVASLGARQLEGTLREIRDRLGLRHKYQAGAKRP